jgi:hypothetical protein
MLLLLYPWVKNPQYPLDRRLGTLLVTDLDDVKKSVRRNKVLSC